MQAAVRRAGAKMSNSSHNTLESSLNVKVRIGETETRNQQLVQDFQNSSFKKVDCGSGHTEHVDS